MQNDLDTHRAPYVDADSYEQEGWRSPAERTSELSECGNSNCADPHPIGAYIDSDGYVWCEACARAVLGKGPPEDQLA